MDFRWFWAGFSGREGFRHGLRETVDWFEHGKNRAAYKADIYNV